MNANEKCFNVGYDDDFILPSIGRYVYGECDFDDWENKTYANEKEGLLIRGTVALYDTLKEETVERREHNPAVDRYGKGVGESWFDLDKEGNRVFLCVYFATIEGSGVTYTPSEEERNHFIVLTKEDIEALIAYCESEEEWEPMVSLEN